MQCENCLNYFRLKCLDSECEQFRLCHLCFTPVTSPNDSVGTDGNQCFLPENLMNVMKSRGMKIMHQNVRSLFKKIDELRLIVSEVNSAVHLITFLRPGCITI